MWDCMGQGKLPEEAVGEPASQGSVGVSQVID